MNGWVLQRTTDGAYVARPGSASSYTRDVLRAELFKDRETAVKASCPENERPRELRALFGEA